MTGIDWSLLLCSNVGVRCDGLMPGEDRTRILPTLSVGHTLSGLADHSGDLQSDKYIISQLELDLTSPPLRQVCFLRR